MLLAELARCAAATILELYKAIFPDNHRICLHIPEHYESLIRYYGYYANAVRGKKKKLGLDYGFDQSNPYKIIDDGLNGRVCRKSWARLIYQVYEETNSP